MVVVAQWSECRQIRSDLGSIPSGYRSIFSLSLFLHSYHTRSLSLLEKAAKWQVDFFQHQDEQVNNKCVFQIESHDMPLTQVKEFIRRAKAWRNKKWPKNERCYGRPKSYFLSVLVLRAYENAVAALGRYASTRAMADRWSTYMIKSEIVSPSLLLS